MLIHEIPNRFNLHSKYYWVLMNPVRIGGGNHCMESAKIWLIWITSNIDLYTLEES